MQVRANAIELTTLFDALKRELEALSEGLVAEEETTPETVATTTAPDVATESDEKHDSIDTATPSPPMVTCAEASKQLRTLIDTYLSGDSDTSLYHHYKQSTQSVQSQPIETNPNSKADRKPIASTVDESLPEQKQDHIDLLASHHRLNNNHNHNRGWNEARSDYPPPPFNANSQLPPQQQPAPLHRQHHYYADYVGGCIGDCFSAVVRHSCGPIQCCILFQLLILLLSVMVFWNMQEVRLTFSTLTQWKELHVEQIRLETRQSIEEKQLEYNLNVDVDKLKVEHQHQERMALITMADNAVKRFIDANTDVTEQWSLNPMKLGTEAQVVSRTHFAEADVTAFRNEIVGFVHEKIGYASNDNNNNNNCGGMATAEISDNGHTHYRVNSGDSFDNL